MNRVKFTLCIALLPVYCIAQDVSQIANSSRDYNWLWVEPSSSGSRYVMAWADDCTTVNFTPNPRAVEASPGQPSRTTELFSFPSCRWAPNLVGRYGILRGRITSSSIRDLGTYTVRCTGAATATMTCRSIPEPNACGIFELCLPQLFSGVHNYDTVVEITNTPPRLSVSHRGTNLLPTGDAAYNSRITLLLEATDPDGGTPDLFWRMVSIPATASGSFIGSSRHSPDVQFSSENDFGVWEFEAIADDAQGERVRRRHTINVVNQVPQPNISGDPRVPFGSNINLSVSSDEDGGAYTSIIWEGQAPGSSIWGVVGNDPTLNLPVDISGVGIWTFRVTVTDNESPPLTGTSSEYTVEAFNEAPRLTISSVSSPFAKVDETSNFRAEAVDPDGGDVQIRVRVMQVPQSSSVAVGSIISSGTNRIDFSRLNTADDAGTWIFEVTAVDDEPPPWQESDSEEVIILVNADPVATITQSGGSTPIGSLTGMLTLSSADSFDPDSPCEDEPILRCHDTHDGSSARSISPGIVGRNWSVLEGALDDGSYHRTGSVLEVFGIRNGTVDLSIPMSGLEPGLWTFQLEVEDGEGRWASTTHMVEIIDENSRPLIFFSAPARYLISPVGINSTSIGFNGRLSFDPDNILSGELPGISNYRWNVLISGIACGSIPPSRNLPLYELYPSGSLILPDCQGVWRAELTVEDDDIPMQSNSASTTLSIGTCPGTVCIDFPTQTLPRIVDFVENTDVLIFYHIDPIVMTNSHFDYGMYARLDIYHQDDLTTPVFTSFSPNVRTNTISPLLVFHWNGYWISGRPRSGKYSIKISLTDYTFTPAGVLFEDFERNAIHIEVDELSITSDSDDYANIDQLKDRSDTLSVGYEIDGTVVPDQVEWRLYNETGMLVHRDNLSPALRGRIMWDGRLNRTTPTTGTFVDSGHCTIEIEAYLRGASLTGTTEHQVTLYKLRFETRAASPELIVMVNNDDDNSNGHADMSEGATLVSGENDLLEVNLVFDPALEGQLQVLTNDSPQKIQLYSNANRGGGPTTLPLNYNLPADTIPPIFIEATQSGPADLRMRFTPTDHAALNDAVQTVRNIGIKLEDQSRSQMDFANIALWADAYSSGMTLSILDTASDHLVEREARRFYIRVDDPAQNADSSASENFNVSLSTIKNDGTINDDASQIRLSEQTSSGITSNNSGSFASESQLLTTPDLPVNADDNYRMRSNFSGIRVDDSIHDRTHKADIESTFSISHTVNGTTLNHKIPVCDREPDSRYRVQVRAHIFRNPATGMPYSSTAYIERQIDRANIAWSPACIKIELIGTPTIHDAPTITPSGGVAPVNILADQIFQFKIGGTGAACRHADCLAVVSTYAAGATEDVVELFIVPGIPGAFAFATIPLISTPGLGLKTFIFLEPNLTENRRILAHEFGHVLTNTGDTHEPTYTFYPQRPWRASDGSTMYDYIVNDSQLNTYRRIFQAAIDQARTDRTLSHCQPPTTPGGLVFDCGDITYPAPPVTERGNYVLKPLR